MHHGSKKIKIRPILCLCMAGLVNIAEFSHTGATHWPDLHPVSQTPTKSQKLPIFPGLLLDQTGAQKQWLHHLEGVKKGHQQALDQVLDCVCFDPVGLCDPILALNIYRWAKTQHPHFILDSKKKHVLELAHQAGPLNIRALADAFCFRGLFEDIAYVNDSCKMMPSTGKEVLDVGYMADRASKTCDLGLPNPKLIFQLVVRFLACHKKRRRSTEMADSDIHLINVHHQAWKNNIVLPFHVQRHLAHVDATGVVFQNRKDAQAYLTDRMLNLIKKFSTKYHPLFQESYQNAMIFFTSSAMIENPSGGNTVSERAWGISAEMASTYYHDLAVKLEPFVMDSEHCFTSFRPLKADATPEKLATAEAELHQLCHDVWAMRRQDFGDDTVEAGGEESALRQVQADWEQYSQSLCALYGQLQEAGLQEDGLDRGLSALDVTMQCRMDLVEKRIAQLTKHKEFLYNCLKSHQMNA